MSAADRRFSRRAPPPVLDPSANNAYVAVMATLNIRNLPDEVHRRLRLRAAEHGRSMEAEARTILADAAMERPNRSLTRKQLMREAQDLQAFIDKLYGGNKPKNVVDDFIAERRREAAREELEQGS
jgi:plasmid stability protein